MICPLGYREHVYFTSLLVASKFITILLLKQYLFSSAGSCLNYSELWHPKASTTIRHSLISTLRREGRGK